MRSLFALALVLSVLALPWASATGNILDSLGDNPTRPTHGPCGVATDPVCWAPKMACQVYGPLVNGTPLECRNFTGPELVRLVAIDDTSLPPQIAGLDTVCRNFGVVIMATGIGTSYYCDGGTCENYGLVVIVGNGEGCYGHTLLLVCWASTCVEARQGIGPMEVGTLDNVA